MRIYIAVDTLILAVFLYIWLTMMHKSIKSRLYISIVLGIIILPLMLTLYNVLCARILGDLPIITKLGEIIN